MTKERTALLATQYATNYANDRVASPLVTGLNMRVRNISFNGMPHLGMGIIASELLKEGWSVRMVDIMSKGIESSLSDEEVNLVMISAIDMGVSRAEELVKQDRLKGKTIIGGQGVDSVADELAKRNSGTAVYTGRSDFDTPRVLESIHQKGGTEGVFERPEPVRLEEYQAHPSLDEKYTFRQLPRFRKSRLKPLEITTGCTQNCEFCPIAGERVSTKPIGTVLNEIDMTKIGKTDTLVIVDHNLFNLKRSYLHDLFDEINKRGIRWAGEGTVSQVVKDEELLRKMAKNCLSFLVGLEDINGQYDGSPVKQKLVQNFEEVLATVRESKLPITWSIVFGLDAHNPDTFINTARFVDMHNLNVNSHLIQPRNGSEFQEQLKKEGRLKNDDSRFRDGAHIVYQPLQMSEDEAMTGFIWFRKFIAKTAHKRFLKNLKYGLRYATALASLEYLGDGAGFLQLNQMYPELKSGVDKYEKSYKKGK